MNDDVILSPDGSAVTISAQKYFKLEYLRACLAEAVDYDSSLNMFINDIEDININWLLDQHNSNPQLQKLMLDWYNQYDGKI